jgi:hypothetical protein
LNPRPQLTRSFLTLLLFLLPMGNWQRLQLLLI